MKTGTEGELLVQLRLLEYGVQAAAPILDTGNDLIGIKDGYVKFIQVKTSKVRMPARPQPNRIWDIVCLVKLEMDCTGELLLDQSKINILERDKPEKDELSQKLVNRIWADNPSRN